MDIVAQILSQEENFAKQAIDAHAELNMAGIPAMDSKRNKLTLVERIRLIPAMAVVTGDEFTCLPLENGIGSVTCHVCKRTEKSKEIPY